MKEILKTEPNNSCPDIDRIKSILTKSIEILKKTDEDIYNIADGKDTCDISSDIYGVIYDLSEIRDHIIEDVRDINHSLREWTKSIILKSN